jgi:16S rRNA (guanine966-N2)-methyltransferase
LSWNPFGIHIFPQLLSIPTISEFNDTPKGLRNKAQGRPQAYPGLLNHPYINNPERVAARSLGDVRTSIMRITGGILRGRRLRVPAHGVRPTQDRVREAVFSMLAPQLPHARVLDLFAGSGAMGLEAWSRGAQAVCAVEQSRETFRVLKQNVEALCGAEAGRIRCSCMDVWRFLKRNHRGEPYDIIFADPPYDPRGASRALGKALCAISEAHILTAEGLLVYEMSAREKAVEQAGWQLLRDKQYGHTRIALYRPSEQPRRKDSE